MTSPRATTGRRLRTVLVALVPVAAIGSTGCAPDPPSAVVAVQADGCGPTTSFGSGGVVDTDGLVLTSAHVVAGATRIEVVAGATSGVARVVAFDPRNDIAYLSVEWTGLPPAGIPIADLRPSAGDTGTAWVIRDGAPVAVPVAVERRIRIRTDDIYRDRETLRPGLELDADIRPGDSGGLVVVDGAVVGVVWARSRRDDRRSYAIDAVAGTATVAAQLRTGELGDGIDPSRC